MNWEIGIEMYTLLCIKCILCIEWITNENLLYTKGEKGVGMNWETGIDIYILFCIKCTLCIK